MKTLEYPLLALTLTERDCAHIMAPILMGGLPACGICCNFPRNVVFAPTKFMGLDLHNPYITMGILHTDLLSSEGQMDSITGDLIRATIEVTKLELGLGISLFQINYWHFSHLPTACWITDVWKFMSKFDIEMVENTESLSLRRIGDKFLIDQFFLHGLKGKTLTRLNRCRLFLQVNSAADIVTADGKWITHDAWHGKLDDMRPHYYSWPNQGDPPARDWALWRKALSISLCDGQERRLTIPLGSWTDKQTHLWRWFFAPAENRMYERVDDHWNVYAMEGGRIQ
jgi:hypothetical protein